jgi:hypothetical protein
LDCRCSADGGLGRPEVGRSRPIRRRSKSVIAGKWAANDRRDLAVVGDVRGLTPMVAPNTVRRYLDTP